MSRQCKKDLIIEAQRKALRKIEDHLEYRGKSVSRSLAFSVLREMSDELRRINEKV